MLGAVSDDDMRELVAVLVKEAKAGNVPAAREVLDRCLGKPEPFDLLQRIDELEGLLATPKAEAWQ
jgi:hypothetical protein